MDKLKRELFNILAYIVEDTINDDDIDKIINEMMMPTIRRWWKRNSKGKNLTAEKISRTILSWTSEWCGNHPNMDYPKLNPRNRSQLAETIANSNIYKENTND